MIRKSLFLFCALLPFLTYGQENLDPEWKKGDTLVYFISESELIEDQRISLKTYEIQLVVKQSSREKTVFEGNLNLYKTLDQGLYWSRFHSELKNVPFTFSFVPGKQNVFSQPEQVGKTDDAIKRLQLVLLTVDQLPPAAYGEISDSLKTKHPENGLPKFLIDHFLPLNKVFNKYGKAIPQSGAFDFVEEIECGDSVILNGINMIMGTSYQGSDTLLLDLTIRSDSNNTLETYAALNQCGKLKGLDTPVKISSYSYVYRETWAATLKDKKIYSYTFDEDIRIGMPEIQNWQRIQKRIICLRQ